MAAGRDQYYRGSPMIRNVLFTSSALALAVPATAQQAAPEALQRQQFIAQMDAEFSRLDGDGNGMIVPAEIAQSQRAAVQAQALEQNRTIFARLDADGDGALTQQEFAKLVNVEAVAVDPAPLMNQFDSDGDGIITLVEYRIGTQANFDRIDTDRDGIATDVEMRAAGIRK